MQALIKEHYEATLSPKAKAISDNFEFEINNFKIIVPCGYKKILTVISEQKAKGLSQEQAEIEAFYSVTGGEK